MSDICSPAVQERNILSHCTLSCIISLRVFSWDISPYTLHIYILNEDIFNMKLHIHEITQSMINQSCTSWALNRTLFNSIYKRQWEAWHARLLDPATYVSRTGSQVLHTISVQFYLKRLHDSRELKWPLCSNETGSIECDDISKIQWKSLCSHENLSVSSSSSPTKHLCRCSSV